MAETVNYESTGGHATSSVAIAIAWIVVIIPAAWGITQTIRQSTQLFKSPPPQVAPVTSSGARNAPLSAPTLGPAATTTTTTAPKTRTAP